MTDRERALRIEIVYDHHIAYGIKIDEDDARAARFLNDTCAVPIEIFRQASKLARQLHTGQFPPSQGALIDAARRIEWERAPQRYRNSGEGRDRGMTDPEWYRRMLKGQSAMYAVQVA